MKFIPLLIALLFASTSAFSQSPSYGVDNFDFRNGVRVQEPPTVQPGPAKRRHGKTAASKSVRPVSADSISAANTTLASSLVKPTAAFIDAARSLISTNVASLRGYTTGSAQIDNYLVQAGTSNGVDPLLLYSVMHQESSFKSHAISPKGARGLMQLMPGTAVRYGVTNVFDPRQNIEGGARYLRFLLNRFDGDVRLALAGYNAGEGAVEKYGWNIPPYAETQEYVRRISRRYSSLQDPNAALYAPRLSGAQAAHLQAKVSIPLAIYERTVATVRLPDGRLQLMSQ